jgi:CBS-domain-containing membrane protein
MPVDAVTDADALRALAEATSVSEVMVTEVVCLSMDTSIDAVVDLFLDKDLAQAPVVDAAWRPLGMVSKNDLLRLFDAQERGLVSAQARVSQVVVPSVISIHPNASLSVAAAIMANEGVHALPIVAPGGEVVGVVSTLDVIRWLAKKTGMHSSDNP